MGRSSIPRAHDGGGLAGTYSATSLSPSGTWSGGGSSGSFTYDYPMAVPPAAGGLQPSVSLHYDSGVVDGDTADTQPQPSWIGDGWSMPTQAFIEQSFIPCQDNPEGTASPVSTPDECYDGAVLTLSLAGQSTPLVCPGFDFTTPNLTCAAAGDNGEVITHHINSGNGQATRFNDYWTVTTRDGTTYSFGINHLKGWASGDPATNSVDVLPVLSSHSGDPCYQVHGTTGTAWANSMCAMAYRWNLDYVTDTHGDAMAYYYKHDSNAYAADGNTTSATTYIRDSHLYHIDYGFTDGNAYAATVPDQVLFTTGDRCFVSGGCDPISTNYKNWLDVPYHADFCAAGASCPVKSPTYWSTVALTTVSTGQNCGPPTSAGASTCTAAADSWALKETLPAQSDKTASLWLSQVTRTGEDATTPGTAGGTVQLKPGVTFGPVEEINRVNPGTNPFIYRMRIGTITSETGSVTTVTYGLPVPCTATNLPPPASNTKSCFPEYWGTFTTTPDWFNKWAVISVQVRDPFGGSPGLFTSYQYASPAWHYDDNEVVQPQYRTYGQWRGYQDVQTFSGTGDPQTETETTYYQGMSDDDNNGTDVTVTDSQHNTHEDSNQLAGDVLESTAYLYPGGPVDHSGIYSYWVSAAAMTRARAGLPDLTANFTGQVEDWARQAITDGGTTTWRDTETDTSYDTGKTDPDFGLPLYVFRHGDLSQPSQQACTSYTYAPVNTANNLAGLPAEVQTDAVPCGGSNPGGSSSPGTGQVNALTAPSSLNYSTQVISDTRTYYDTTVAAGSPLTAPAWPQANAPAAGDATLVQDASGYDSSTGQLTFQTTAATAYDSYGRPVRSYDAKGGWNGSTYNPTATSYTMTNGSTTAVTVTNPLGQATTTAYDPVRGLPVKVTDPNNVAATMQYDELGRLTAVWQYNRTAPATPNLAYTYTPSSTGPTVVTTKKLNEIGGATTTITLYDSLLRVRQIQAQAPLPQGGELVSDNFYDSRGWLTKVNTNEWNNASPVATLLSIPDSQQHSQTITQYDGLGRPVIVTSYDITLQPNTVQSVDYTQYTGDKVIAVATGPTPATILPGATATATDALGRTTELDSYTTAPAIAASTNPGGFAAATITGGASQATRYAYDTRGRPSATTDAATGEAWTRTYDQLGNIKTSTDPNSGTTTMTYDADGNITSATGQNQHTISYTYDLLGRITGQYDGPLDSSPKIATYVYDNANGQVTGADPIGQLTTATSYDPAGNAYVFQQNGFNQWGESTGETVTIPATPATSTASGSLATTYSIAHVYTGTTGLPLMDFYPASPGASPALPAERITYGYCSFDLPCSESSLLTEQPANVTIGYVQDVQYNPWSQVTEQEIGAATSPDNADIKNTYDQHTGALTDTNIANANISATPYDDTAYAYDPAGNLTSEQDVRNGAQTELQCFNYDLLDRLTRAWTTDGTHPCTAGPSTGTGGTVSDGIPGGQYWTQWAYNPLGDQTSQTSKSLTGGPDSVTCYNYGKAGGAQPDTLTSAAPATSASACGTATADTSYTYDPQGNTVTRDLPGGNQALTWNDNGTLQTDQTSAGTTSYVYDPAGNLLLQEDPGQTTLYIFGEQLVLNTSTGAITGTRFLPLPGGGTAVRTGPDGNYWFETTDQHGTSLLTLDHTAANPAWRQYTPYGAPRGTTPATWPDTNGYLSSPTGTNTGLTTIGARNYDPSTGRFISIDPVLESGSPQQLNGYSYAAGNPITQSDPTGLAAPGGSICTGSADCNGPGDQPPPGYQWGGGSPSDPNRPEPTPVSEAQADPPTPGSDGGCGLLGWRCVVHGATTLVGSAGNNIIDGALSLPSALDQFLTGFINGFPTGDTGTQLIMGNNIKPVIPHSPLHIGDPHSILYQVGYYGTALALLMLTDAGDAGEAGDIAGVAGADPFAAADPAAAAPAAAADPAAAAPAAEEGRQAATLRAAVEEQYQDVVANQSIRVRGPVLSGAMNTQTGDIYFGQNTGIPDPLAPELRMALDDFEGPGAEGKGIPGAHSEVNAVNQGLLENPDSQISDYIFYSIRLRGTLQGEPIGMCPNCAAILGQ